MEYTSKGVGNAALTTGIIGTAGAALNMINNAEAEEKDEKPLYEQVLDSVYEEYNDVSKYVDMVRLANDPCIAQILRDIAKEEYTHGRHLEEILSEFFPNGNNQELMKLKMKAKEDLQSV